MIEINDLKEKLMLYSRTTKEIEDTGEFVEEYQEAEEISGYIRQLQASERFIADREVTTATYRLYIDQVNLINIKDRISSSKLSFFVNSIDLNRKQVDMSEEKK